MAKRYRYSFTKKKEAEKGKVSLVIAILSFLLLVTAVAMADLLEGSYGFVTGGV